MEFSGEIQLHSFPEAICADHIRHKPKAKTVQENPLVHTCRVLILSRNNTFLFETLLSLLPFIELSIPVQNTVCSYILCSKSHFMIGTYSNFHPYHYVDTCHFHEGYYFVGICYHHWAFHRHQGHPSVRTFCHLP